MRKIFIIDSHPIQYKAPVFREIARLTPDVVTVIYATDVSARSGYKDTGFGEQIKWDVPLLDGYDYEVLGATSGTPLKSRTSLRGKGLFSLFRKNSPRIVILCQSRYLYDLWAYVWAILFRCRIWIRQETQDEMFGTSRSLPKRLLRRWFYRAYYFPVEKAFCFGELNRQHLLRHGFSPSQLVTAHFSTNNPFLDISSSECVTLRRKLREKLGVDHDCKVIGFYGKLIPKKNPEAIFEAMDVLLDQPSNHRICLLFVGSGALREVLEQHAAALEEKHGIRTIFTGFVNQTELPDYYASSDVVVLPSRPMGEAWGLVVNEALQAGCALVVSDAVGCAKEFAHLERFRVYQQGVVAGLASSIRETLEYGFDPKWAEEPMKRYSTEAAAAAISGEIMKSVTI